jgi:hypothetical protein
LVSQSQEKHRLRGRELKIIAENNEAVTGQRTEKHNEDLHLYEIFKNDFEVNQI